MTHITDQILQAALLNVNQCFIQRHDRCYRILYGDNTPLQHMNCYDCVTSKRIVLEADAEDVFWVQCLPPHKSYVLYHDGAKLHITKQWVDGTKRRKRGS